MSEGKQRKSKNKNCPYYDDCQIRLHPLSSTDKSNAVAHLGFRFLYTILAWCVLGLGISDNFFVSMFLFVLPILMDCVKFKPVDRIRHWINRIEILITGFWSLVSLLGMVGILILEKDGLNWIIKTSENFVGFILTPISVKMIWCYLITTVAVTMIDWFCNKDKLTMACRKNTK